LDEASFATALILSNKPNWVSAGTTTTNATVRMKFETNGVMLPASRKLQAREVKENQE